MCIKWHDVRVHEWKIQVAAPGQNGVIPTLAFRDHHDLFGSVLVPLRVGPSIQTRFLNEMVHYVGIGFGGHQPVQGLWLCIPSTITPSMSYKVRNHYLALPTLVMLDLLLPAVAPVESIRNPCLTLVEKALFAGLDLSDLISIQTCACFCQGYAFVLICCVRHEAVLEGPPRCLWTLAYGRSVLSGLPLLAGTTSTNNVL